MMTKKITPSRWLIFAGLMLALSPITATSQVNLIHWGDNKAVSKKKGIIYSLPRTVINVSLVVNKIQKTRGPYAEFAEKYLGISEIITNNSTEYQLKKISLSTTSEPDPEQFYFVELKHKSSGKKKSIELHLSEAGLLQDAPGVLKSRSHNMVENDMHPTTQNAFTDILNPSYYEHMDTVIRSVKADTTTRELKVFRKITSEKDPEQKAKEAADLIIELDEYKLNLLSGDQEVGFGTNLLYMCNQLEAMKVEYLALFKGITSITPTTYHYSFIPNSGETSQDITLCGFSKQNGITEISGPGNYAITLHLESQGITKSISGYIKSNKPRRDNLRGFSYRIPDYAKVTVTEGGQTRMETVLGINQLGFIFSVPAGNLSSIQLYPATGCIKQVIFE